MKIHESLSITSTDQLFALLRTGAVFHSCQFDGAELTGLDAEFMEFESCSLRRADFSGLVCPSLRILGSDAQGACFEDADIQEAEFLRSVRTSANFRGAKLNLSRMVDCDLSLSNFDGATLFGIALCGSRMRGVDLTHAKLDVINIDRVGLSMATSRYKGFRRQKLVGVNLTDADMYGVRLHPDYL